MLPLLVHVIFHPQSAETFDLAGAIHRALNEDPAVPGLRIPTRFTVEDGTGLPPVEGDRLKEAERVFVVILADDYLTVGFEGKLPEGRKNWGEWVADLYEACEINTKHRCVPFQLSEDAWPLDKRLSAVNFPRAWAVDTDKRENWVIQRLILELVRFLQGEPTANEDAPKAPLQVFLSHTKLDLKQKPKVVKKISKYLSHDQPVDAWFDSGDIPGGSRFAEEIAKGIQNSALLSVLTDSYSSREWCRKEVLLAKKYKRPIVVVDAIQNQEVRSFPYSGNVPVIRWSGNPEKASEDSQKAIYLLFKEALRQNHSSMVLNQYRSNDYDLVLNSEPELATLIGQQDKTILYPDPPLGNEELELITQSNVKVETPLQRYARNRFLKGTKIAVSLSESSDIRKYGPSTEHFDQVAIEICRYLLLAGATLCYGGHLGSEGYTQALFELVRTYPLPGIEPVERVVNYRGWPLPKLTVKEKAKYKKLAEFVLTSRPADLSEDDASEFIESVENFFPADSPLRRFAWARGMSIMREQQTQDVQARVVMGGKIGSTITASAEGGREENWYSSSIPGVLEEILISLQHEQPVYLVGGFGGCTRMVSDILQGISRTEMSWDFHKQAPYAVEMRELYETRAEVSWWSYEDMTLFLQNQGIDGLRNGLSLKENEELFKAVDPGKIVTLILRGLQNSLNY